MHLFCFSCPGLRLNGTTIAIICRRESRLLALRILWLLLYCCFARNTQVCRTSAGVRLSCLHGVLVHIGTCARTIEAPQHRLKKVRCVLIIILMLTHLVACRRSHALSARTADTRCTRTAASSISSLANSSVPFVKHRWLTLRPQRLRETLVRLCASRFGNL